MGSISALLIIDMQVGNFEGSKPVYRGNDLLAKIKGLIAQVRAAGVSVIYVQHYGPEGAIDQYGTSGWEIHPAIAPTKDDIVIQKRHPDVFQETRLRNELESRDITRLIIAGIQTEYCIDTTCRRAYSLGYEVTLVKDAHGTWDTDNLTAPQIIVHHNDMLDGRLVELKEANEIVFGTKS